MNLAETPHSGTRLNRQGRAIARIVYRDRQLNFKLSRWTQKAVGQKLRVSQKQISRAINNPDNDDVGGDLTFVAKAKMWQRRFQTKIDRDSQRAKTESEPESWASEFMGTDHDNDDIMCDVESNADSDLNQPAISSESFGPITRAKTKARSNSAVANAQDLREKGASPATSPAVDPVQCQVSVPTETAIVTGLSKSMSKFLADVRGLNMVHHQAMFEAKGFTSLTKLLEYARLDEAELASALEILFKNELSECDRCLLRFAIRDLNI
ncbi:hypothetical protein MIND_01258900 [Mycena indigotica]|uniref:Uncharacterized protein n=1 Tax=Mycena indigotica TaxID=2126181 RepID=A0A8H6S2C2_9AGAR|nr:uncharacterized protein MIND_01258900 [Mycena indigotica]KAF7291157.1 hypothetical protein MIND_01258900 [Mycena indigotica]